ncbi:MAG: DUF4331 family protein [Candidatus Eiseniibacteriota bacterium]
MRTRTLAGRLAAAAAVTIAGSALAADHAEAPGTKADPAADIADIYAWHDGDALVTVLTFDGLKTPSPGQTGTFEEGIVYTVNIDNDGDYVADIRVDSRFVTDSRGNRGIYVQNLPGANGPVVGFVESAIAVNGRDAVFAGLIDDPFFFDLEGFRATLATGTLSFDSSRDSFAGLNVTAIALRMDLGAALDGGSTLNLWATTAR